jgi:hypothetical protein
MLLHCENLEQPMSHLGHFRPSSVGFADRPLPLSPKSGHSASAIITIDLSAGGGGVETYEKTIKIDATDGDGPNNLIPLEGKSDGDE